MATKPQDKAFLSVAHKVHLASSSTSRFRSSLKSGSFVGSRSQLTSSKSGLTVKPVRPPLVVRDDKGRDVTPKSLFCSSAVASAPKPNLTSILYGGASKSDGQKHDVNESMTGSMRASVDTSQFIDGFSRSIITDSQNRSSMIGNTARQSVVQQGLIPTDTSHPPLLYKESHIPLELNEEELESDIAITLSETETIWIFDMPPTAVPADSEEAQEVEEKNTKYQELCASRAGNDRYVQRGMQTINPALKLKGAQTVPVMMEDVGVMATAYDMHKTFAANTGNEDVPDDDDTLQLAIVMDASRNPGTSTIGSRTNSMTWTDTSLTTSVVDHIPGFQGCSTVGTSIDTSIARQLTTPSCVIPGSKNVPTPSSNEPDAPVELRIVDDHPVFKSPQLYNTFAILERAVALNNHQKEQALYRNFEPHLGTRHDFPDDATLARSDDQTSLDGGTGHSPGLSRGPSTTNIEASQQADVDMSASSTPRPFSTAGRVPPRLNRLWTYSSPATTGRNVSCLAWNKNNKDVLAVGYGQFAFGDDKQGLVCCWSIKNPEYPERTYELPQGVMSVDFSHLQPCLLAAGLYDGTINIYNVQGHLAAPVFQCSSAVKHTGPVWQVSFVKQVNRDSEEPEEMLVSVSSDGRVSKWSAKRGFEQTDLILLKQTSRRAAQHARQTLHSTVMKEAKRSDGLLMRHASGMCFDFERKREGNTYLVGTEEGYVHKCSVSYNEQYLETYVAHTGPVYRILWSPFHPKAFLTSSADWSVRLWHVDQVEPIDSYNTAMKAVLDIAWSPTDPSVFATVSQGRIEVWDLSATILDPVIVHEPIPAYDLTYVEFAKNANALLVGNSDGQVTVYQLCDMMTSPFANQLETLDKILKGEMKTK